jgi:hypothetical protein
MSEGFLQAILVAVIAAAATLGAAYIVGTFKSKEGNYITLTEDEIAALERKISSHEVFRKIYGVGAISISVYTSFIADPPFTWHFPVMFGLIIAFCMNSFQLARATRQLREGRPRRAAPDPVISE